MTKVNCSEVNCENNIDGICSRDEIQLSQAAWGDQPACWDDV